MLARGECLVMYVKPEIIKTPKITKKEYTEFKTDDEILREIINRFTYVLEKNVSRDSLILFYNNIGTLKVENKSIFKGLIPGLFRTNTVTGRYYLDDNVISLFPLKNKNFIGLGIEGYVANLCHELLHMSSTLKCDEKMVFSGFCQMGDFGVGMALDDAYTEMLLYRYFDLNKEYMSCDYEVIITNLIEEIIGIDIMTTLYFGANLYGLVMELSKYNVEDNIVKFIEDLDSIYALQDYRMGYKKDIIYYHNEIAYFIVNSYKNKLDIELESNIITKDEYDMKLDKIFSDIHMAFEKLEIKDRKVRKRNGF